MGGKSSKSKKYEKDRPNKSKMKPSFRAIPDEYRTLDEVQKALREAGLESSNLIIGIDFTKSNTWNGTKTFYGQNLHTLLKDQLNPYQEVISIMGRTLEPFDDDKLIPVFGFGDITTADKTVFPFWPDRFCYGFQEVLNRYTEIVPQIQYSGPTSFAPLINASLDIVKKENSYHILIIIADGQVDAVKATTDAIVEASNFPLSIICVGVGDGPWELMREFDDKLPTRKFDNFQFVPYYDTMVRAENRDITFSVAALQEIPEQYKSIKELGLM